MTLVDSDPVNGTAKLWLYQFAILHKLSWSFMLYDFTITMPKRWDSRTGVYLKKWARIFRNADVGILFRRREAFGLQMSTPSFHFKKMQIIKSHILKYSPDPSIRSLFATREQHESTFRWKNRGSHFLSHITPVVTHNLQFPNHTTKQGLGHGEYIPPNSVKEHRALLIDTLSKEESKTRLAHRHSLVLQGVWTHWIDYVEPFKFSWNNIIYNIHPQTTIIHAKLHDQLSRNA